MRLIFRNSLMAFRKAAAVMVMMSLLTFVSCSDGQDDDSIPPVVENVGKTLFMYFPWSTNLLDNFNTNIDDMSVALASVADPDVRVVVFLSTSPDKAEMFELVPEAGTCRRKMVKTYESPALTTAEGIYAILSDVFDHAPADTYAMTIGCHGMGWVPVIMPAAETASATAPLQPMHWDAVPAGGPGAVTRFFGGMSPAYQTDVSTLVEALRLTGQKMQFILFDDCYMSNVEVAYELRDVTHYLIASASEMMAFGLPYARIGRYLVQPEPDYAALCRGFLEFYSAADMPYGNLAVTDCSHIESVAAVMRVVNNHGAFPEAALDTLQNLDGYRPPLFYDLGAFARTIAADDTDLYDDINRALWLAVPHKVNTPRFYTMTQGVETLRTFSGLTISQPSTNQLAVKAWSFTPWARATL